MTSKERLLAAIAGKEVDRVPWSPFLAYYWESLPREQQEKGQVAFLEEIGADPLLRGFHQVFDIKRNKCSATESISGKERIVRYDTPVGIIQEKYIYTPAANTWFLMEHPVKREEDFKVLLYLYEDMVFVENHGRFNEDYRNIGERGLYVPVLGPEMKTSFQSLVERWVGTEDLVYALADYPETVEECLQVMENKAVESVKISVQSQAEAFIFWEDSSTTNISPAYFEKYTAPEVRKWADIIHDSGKYLLHHACGHLRALLDSMSKTGIDMIESISPPPTGNIELWEAREIIPENIGLIGGIEPTVFLNSTLEELEEYVLTLLKKVDRKRFILANSDSCPPGVALEKFKLVTEIVKR